MLYRHAFLLLTNKTLASNPFYYDWKSFSRSNNEKALEKVLVGWEDLTEEDGTPIQFSKAELKNFAEDTDFVAGVLDAFKKFYANSQVGN